MIYTLNQLKVGMVLTAGREVVSINLKERTYTIRFIWGNNDMHTRPAECLTEQPRCERTANGLWLVYELFKK